VLFVVMAIVVGTSIVPDIDSFSTVGGDTSLSFTPRPYDLVVFEVSGRVDSASVVLGCLSLTPLPYDLTSAGAGAGDGAGVCVCVNVDVGGMNVDDDDIPVVVALTVLSLLLLAAAAASAPAGVSYLAKHTGRELYDSNRNTKTVNSFAPDNEEEDEEEAFPAGVDSFNGIMGIVGFEVMVVVPAAVEVVVLDTVAATFFLVNHEGRALTFPTVLADVAVGTLACVVLVDPVFLQGDCCSFFSSSFCSWCGGSCSSSPLLSSSSMNEATSTSDD
jgi:hypothetical protein